MPRKQKRSAQDTVLKAGIYCRVSTPGQEEEGTSLQTQDELCRQYALSRGYQIHEQHVYRETHTGAELWERPYLTRARQAMRQGEVQVLVAYAIDRLSRNPVHLGVVLSEAEYHGGQVEFVTEPIDRTPEGDLIRFVRGYAAQVEREKIRERALRGKRARIQSGKLHNHGRELYGYRRNHERGVREIYLLEATVVRQIFAWYVDDHLGIRAIARRLQAEGIPAPSLGKITYSDKQRVPRWGQGQVQRILSEPAYNGETIEWRYHPEGGLRPESEWLRLKEGTTPALVSPETWAAAQQCRLTNTGAYSRNQARPYFLRGHIVCAVCGLPMRTNPDRTHRTYRCASREKPGGACGGKRVPAEAVEPWVWDQLTLFLRDPETTLAQLARQRQEGPDKMLLADREATERRLAIMERQQTKFLHAFRDTDDLKLPWDLMKRELAQIEQEKTQLQAALSDIDARLSEQRAQFDRFVSVAAYVKRVARNLETFGFEEKRVVLEALNITVIGNGHDWRIKVDPWIDELVGTLSQTSRGSVHHARFSFELPLLPSSVA